MTKWMKAMGVAVAAMVAGSAAPLAAPGPAGLPDKAKYLSHLSAYMKVKWPRNRTINIVCHGHSVPAGYFKTPVVDTFNAYPHLLHVALKKRFPHAVINVINTAVGGENSVSGAARFEKDVLGHRPDLITIDYALNDRGLGVDRARKALTSMLELARQKNVPVLLLTPTPDQSARLHDPGDKLNQQAQMIRILAAAKGVGLVDSYAAFKAQVQQGTPLKDLMSQVNHPNRAGHDLVVAELIKWFP
ncbi:MAG: SGNH/GDSL hydrolase family protein [Phycisphaeraceae bacterium]|nr:SGNH/GDSL hydrolase family protein [Phycisphaeraceae bacterium]